MFHMYCTKASTAADSSGGEEGGMRSVSGVVSRGDGDVGDSWDWKGGRRVRLRGEEWMDCGDEGWCFWRGLWADFEWLLCLRWGEAAVVVVVRREFVVLMEGFVSLFCVKCVQR